MPSHRDLAPAASLLSRLPRQPDRREGRRVCGSARGRKEGRGGEDDGSQIGSLFFSAKTLGMRPPLKPFIEDVDDYD